MLNELFVLLNFAVVVAVMYYAWNRFGVSALNAMAHKTVSERELLHEEHHKLMAEAQRLDESLVAQGKECKELSSKVEQWREVVNQLHERKVEYYLKQQKAYSQKLEEQAEKLSTERLYKKIKPLVLSAVEQELRAYFKDPVAQQAYRERLLKELQS